MGILPKTATNDNTRILYWDSMVAELRRFNEEFIEEEQPKKVKKKRHPMAPAHGRYREPFGGPTVFIRPEYHARSNPR